MSLFELQQRWRAGEIRKTEYIAAMSRLHSALFEYAALTKNTDVRAIHIADGEVVFTLKGPVGDMEMICDPADQRMAPLEIMNFGGYEQADFEMVQRLLHGCRTVFDVGANIGWYSLQIAKVLPAAQIVAFEPIPSTFRYLKNNVERNRATNVSLYNSGFWNKTEILTFYFYPEGSGNASAVNVSDRAHVQEIQCQVIRLDDFVAEHKMQVDFIKCDVEGAEKLVFEGGLQTLERDKPIIYTEMLRKWSAKFDYHPNQTIQFFADLGYGCYTASDGRLHQFYVMDESTVATNFFFLHTHHHGHLLRAWI